MDAQSPTRVLPRESLSQKAYVAIRRDILTGRYRLGDKLILRTIANELGISLTPVRDALTRLISESALTQVDHHSVRIPVITPECYAEILDLRTHLEGRAAETAAELATPEQTAFLTEVHERMIEAKIARRYADIHIENERFHMGLCEIAKLPVLRRLLESLWLQCGPVFASVNNETLLDFPEHHPHLTILEGLRTNDRKLAYQGIKADVFRPKNNRNVIAFLHQYYARNDAARTTAS